VTQRDSDDEREAIRLAAFRMQRYAPDPAAIPAAGALLERCAQLLGRAGFYFWRHPDGHWALSLERTMPPVVLVVANAESIHVRLANEQPPAPGRVALTYNRASGAWEDDREPLPRGERREEAPLMLMRMLVDTLDRGARR
jgi:hypothetical protein